MKMEHKVNFEYFGLVIGCGGFKTTISQLFALDDSYRNLFVLDVDLLYNFKLNEILKDKWLQAIQTNDKDDWRQFNMLYYEKVRERLMQFEEEKRKEYIMYSVPQNVKIVLLAHHWEIFEFLSIKEYKVMLMADEKFNEVLRNEKNDEKAKIMQINRLDLMKYEGEIMYYKDVLDLKSLILLHSAYAQN